MTTIPRRRLGKQPPRLDARTLRFSRYRTPLLPPPPETDDNYSRVPVWGMLSNATYGDCVLAGSAHHILAWTTYAQSPRCPSEREVVDLYLRLSPRDGGLVILDTLNHWRRDGLWGDFIDSYVALDPGSESQAKQAIHLFGGIKVGLALPDVNTFGPWERVTGPPNPYNGHDVALVGYDVTGFWAVSWGELMHLSWEWYSRYADEAYAVLSPDWLTVEGVSIDGFDLATLRADLALVTSDVPAPEPQPEPEPPGCLGRLFPFLSLIWRKP